jgi:hypothetical protein
VLSAPGSGLAMQAAVNLAWLTRSAIHGAAPGAGPGSGSISIWPELFLVYFRAGEYPGVDRQIDKPSGLADLLLPAPVSAGPSGGQLSISLEAFTAMLLPERFSNLLALALAQLFASAAPSAGLAPPQLPISAGRAPLVF